MMLPCSLAFAVMESGRINQRVMPALDIKKTSDMYFPDAFSGSPSFTIEAGNMETAMNASFIVTGEPSKRVTVILPHNKVTLYNGRSRGKIIVRNFNTNVGTSTNLDTNGELLLYVGATRDEIPARTPSGDYSGNFCITVMY